MPMFTNRHNRRSWLDREKSHHNITEARTSDVGHFSSSNGLRLSVSTIKWSCLASHTIACWKWWDTDKLRFKPLFGLSVLAPRPNEWIPPNYTLMEKKKKSNDLFLQIDTVDLKRDGTLARKCVLFNNCNLIPGPHLCSAAFLIQFELYQALGRMTEVNSVVLLWKGRSSDRRKWKEVLCRCDTCAVSIHFCLAKCHTRDVCT